MFVCIHVPHGAPSAAELAQQFSPWIEARGASTAIFSLTPRQLAERAWERIPAQLAVASTIEAAILAAHNLPGRTFIPPGEEQQVLGSLPIDCLAGPLSIRTLPSHSVPSRSLPTRPLPSRPLPSRDRQGAVELFEILDRWGIHTLSDLARLPEADLSARLGDSGLHLHRLARGALSRPLRPNPPAATYEESAEFDHPIELREPLLFVIGRFLYDLTARMRHQSLAAQALSLTFNGTERKLSLPFPTLDLKLLLKLVEHSLDRQPPEAPIERIHLALEPTRPRRVQHGLFTPAAPEPEKLELTLGKIRGLVGEANVGYPELFDTHRPGAGKPLAYPDQRVLLPALAFRHFRPPLEAQVEAEAGVMKYLSTKIFRGRVVQISGPWRTSGDWWSPGKHGGQAGGTGRVVNPSHEILWSRDEWDLTLSDGALYRLVRNRVEQQWFVEGVYD